MKKIIYLIPLFYLSFQIETIAQFTGGSATPTVGLITQTNRFNNVLFGPNPVAGTPMTRLYLNTSGTTTLSLDHVPVTGVGNSMINFNSNGTTAYSMYYNLFPAQGSGMFHISATTSPTVGIHMSSNAMYFTGNYSPCNGPGCPGGQYQFLGSVYNQSLNVGNGQTTTPALNVTGNSYFSNLVGLGTMTPGAQFHVLGTSAGSTNGANIARFQTTTNTNTDSYINIGRSTTNGFVLSINGSSLNTSTQAVLDAPILLQANSSNLGVGSFTTSDPSLLSGPQSKLNIQGGAFQVTNSDAPVDRLTRTGLYMGSVGFVTRQATDYSWMQSSSGPLLLNPLSGNTLTGAQTNNYVAIGYLPSATELSTPPLGGYNLLVSGKVKCEELKISLKNGAAWPDYVFASDYKLMSVDSLQNYIAQNNHLPDVPSASEVEENGIMAGEMNAVLLKKIEELTLYMIEQNKNSETQAEQIELLKKQNELLMLKVQLLMVDKTK